jgi:hypothetical protein
MCAAFASVPALVCAGAAAAAQSPPQAAASAAEKSPGPLEKLQQLEQRMFAAGWRLAAGNAPFCESATLSLGLLLHDAQSYDEPDAVRRVFGLSGDIGVQAVAPGSPAEAAGLRPNFVLIEAAAALLARDFPSAQITGEPRWQRMVQINDRIESYVAHNGAALLRWQEASSQMGDQPIKGALVPGVPACPSRFEVHGGHGRALADGKRVILGSKFPGFDYPEAELAAAIAHELAHNVLGHHQLRNLPRAERPRNIIRLTERDADRMMPWLLANAGYDPKAAVRFMERWGPRHGGGLFRKRSHDGWDERAAMIAAETELVEKALEAEGKADWRRLFVPLSPEQE